MFDVTFEEPTRDNWTSISFTSSLGWILVECVKNDVSILQYDTTSKNSVNYH